MSDLEDMVRRIVRDELAKQSPANDEASGFLSVAEAAAFARVSVYTIRRWVKQGQLKRHDAGSRILVKHDELQRLLESDAPSDSIEDRVKRRFG
jgi:excisionase family DNA binding protein